MNYKAIINKLEPQAAIPGGEIQIVGSHFMRDGVRSRVSIDNLQAQVVTCSESLMVATVPSNAHQGMVKVILGEEESDPLRLVVASFIAGNLHPVGNPAVDKQGTIYTTFSGSRGQKVPASVFKIVQGEMTPYLSGLMNPTGLAFNSKNELFISSRFDGTVYLVKSETQMEIYAKGLGVATGIVFDADDNLYVGDRSGTIFKIDRDRRTFVFATLEPSVSAYHLALDTHGDLYVSGPTIGCLDAVHRISSQGGVERYFPGLGRPQGMVFDWDGNLLVAASLKGRRGVVRIDADRRAAIAIAGSGIVGMAFDPSEPNDLILATVDSLYRLNLALVGRPLTN